MESYTVRDLTFTYPGQKRKALDGVSFSLRRGQFAVLCGPSGCGKTTLLRQLKPALAPHGVRSGSILLENVPLEFLDFRTQSAKIGFVLQNPDSQIVTDKVWHELAFGLESLGAGTPEIRLRVAEMASFFGIQNWFHRDVSELSGGQKQLLNLAAVMTMQPSVLLLDEPTGQLDPIAASDFLAAVSRLNRELGVTVLMTEHRLEEVIPLSDRVLVMDKGRLLFGGAPREAGEFLWGTGNPTFYSMPAPMRAHALVSGLLPCPVTAREGRVWLEELCRLSPPTQTDFRDPPVPERKPESRIPAVEAEGLRFRYDKDGPDTVRDLSLRVFPGELYALTGGNGTGKTTVLSLLSGERRPYRGEVRLFGRPLSRWGEGALFRGLLGVLPQNPEALFARQTVRAELEEMLPAKEPSGAGEAARLLREVCSLCQLDGLLNRHPYDLSGGEQQRAALAKILLLRPRVLLLDEPTKGMDGAFKRSFAAILRTLLDRGAAVILVSHDLEFCAEYADRCALFFDGSVVSEGPPRDFFSGNSFYTTAVNRMSRGLLDRAVTVADIGAAFGKSAPSPVPPEGGEDAPALFDSPPPVPPLPAARPAAARPRWRRWLLLPAAAVFSGTLLYARNGLTGLFAFLSGGSLSAGIAKDGAAVRWYLTVLLLLAGSLLAAAWALFGGRRSPEQRAARAPLPLRTRTAAALILAAIPATIFVGVYYLNDRKYFFISLLVLLEAMLPFFLTFEGRKPQARELIVISVLCALGVAGRAAFFMLPQFKPVLAVAIIAGIALGGEAGFLTGAVIAVVSNIFLGQGPWTPWQMFAFGFIGFLAGVLFRPGLLRRSRAAISVFGGLSALFLFGGIMNPASVLMFQNHPTKEMFLLAYLQGIPFDLVHAATTALLLLLLSRPLLDRLDRVKRKYGFPEF